MVKYLFAICVLFSTSKAYDRKSGLDTLTRKLDTTIVGKLIDYDSIFIRNRSSYFGTKYYYGVHHLKIVLIDIKDGKIKDTLILAYVYNSLSEHSLYLKNFKLMRNKNYIFNVCYFMPCKSDFPRMQGFCDDNNYFLPESNRLIEKYKHIYRIINIFDYQELGH